MYDIMTVNDIMIVTFRYEHYATDVAGCTYLWDNTIWRSLLSGWLYSIRGGSRHGCGMRLTPHPPLAPKPFDHGLNEWIALSMGWWAQPPPPPFPPSEILELPPSISGRFYTFIAIGYVPSHIQSSWENCMEFEVFKQLSLRFYT